MLSEILSGVNNYFERTRHDGEYVIAGGVFTALPDELQNGQYIRIVGSRFNDGVWLLPALDLTDETFTGSVYGLAIPRDFLNLADEIEAWEGKNTPSGFDSESFGSYTYKRASVSGGAPVTWRDAFRQRLNQWRKL